MGEGGSISLGSARERGEAGARRTVAIIGGGFTGATLAAQLLQHSGDSVSVILVDSTGYPGRGVAYGTHYGWHLLNVIAGNMSALPDDPEHFVRWAQANHDAAAGRETFLPRRVYGQYISAFLFETATVQARRFFFRRDEAVSITAGAAGGMVLLRSGDTVVADKVVLALGNFPPSDPKLPGKAGHSARYVRNAWPVTALKDVAQNGEILLLGSGLTAVDQVLALRADGFRGTVHILSRHGLLPHAHKSAAPWPPFWNEGSPRTARGLSRLVREQAKAAHKAGEDWRGVIDSLRPCTQSMWRSLPTAEQRRFFRHLRPYWEIHRHRVAPEIGDLMAQQLLGGQVHIHAGRITRYEEGAHGVAITYRRRTTGDSVRLLVDRVVNCTGPETDCRKADSPLLRDLRQKGLMRPGPLHLGLDVDEYGALLDSNGVPSDFLYAIGPLRKGALWETTAVPEIRAQIAELVHTLELSLGANFFAAQGQAAD